MWKEIVIVGLILLTGLQWAYYQTQGNPVTATDAAFKIFMTTLGTGLTVLVLDKIWTYEDRKRWKVVKDEVHSLLSDEVHEIFADFAVVLIPMEVMSGNSADIIKKTIEFQFEELSKLASAKVDEIKKRLLEEEHLLSGDYGELFDKRYSYLNDIDMKYGKFLEPKILKPLINLQRHLKSLSGNIRVRKKMKGTLGEILVSSFDESISYRVHEIVKTLEEFKTIGVLKSES
jgi:hypothetical protein